MPTINFCELEFKNQSIKWVNHNGWIDIFVIKENYFFCSYFRHISLCFYSNFKRESSLDVEFNSASNEYPHCVLLTDPTTPKTRNTWKSVMMTSSTHFSGISYFWGSGIHQKYAMWVLVGCRIKFHIQWDLPLEIWVKKQGDMSKIRTKKSIVFMTNMSIQPIWLTHFIGILLVPKLQLTRNYCWHVFL